MFKKLAQMTLTRSARNDKRPGGSAIDGRTSHKAGYVASQIVRKRVEEPFGWGKTAVKSERTGEGQQRS